MRLFVAVELPASVITVAAAVSEELRERVARVAPRARLTWVAADRLHVTLRFLGQVGDDQAAAIAQALAPPFDVPPFPLGLGDVGTFPGRGAPRTVWIALARGAEACRSLAGGVSARLDLVGIPREPRLIPHLTLARVREPGGLRGQVLTDVVVPPHPGGSADAITLFESRLSSRGPTYTALQRTPLRGG